MKLRKRQVQTFSIFTTFLLIFSLILPGFVGATSNSKTVSLNSSKVSVEEKIDETLLENFESEEKVRFLVRFTEKADLDAVVSNSKEKAEANNYSAYKQEITQRSAVISELKTTALQSQAKVKQYLDEVVNQGNAEDVHSYYIVNGLAVTATKEVAEKIASFAEVDRVLPDRMYQLMETDSFSKEEVEAVDNTSEKETSNQTQSIEWNVDRIQTPDVWGMGFDGSGTVVANMDTGVEWDHPALKEQYRGYDAATGEVDHTYSFFDPVSGAEEAYDHDSHGTHVMGTMVGSEGDANQVGVAPGAEWIAVQAFGPQGAAESHLIAGAEWLLAPGGDVTMAPDVVNNSWGGGPGYDDWFRDAVIAWRAAEIVPVFAAGNITLTNPGGPGSVANPANYPESFAVGNTTSDDLVANSSLRGPSPEEYGSEIKPDVAAPGSGIRSAVPGGGYGFKSGTSMAAPAVAGAVALLRQVNSDLTVDQIEEILMETAEGTTSEEYPESPNHGYGQGIIDIYAAIGLIADGLGTIEGTVTMDGEDTEDPVFEHTPPNGMLEGKDLKLNINVSDNVSVTSVELNYDGKTVEADRVSGDFRSGEYSVTVPAEEITGETFTYYWTMNDFGGNEVETDSFTVEFTEPVFYENFNEDPEWTIFEGGEASTWEWGAPTTGPGSALTGDNVYATNLSGDYNVNEFSWLEMPALNISGDNAFVEFDHWFSTENNWDNAHFVVTNDPEDEFQILGTFTGESDGWVTSAFDISDYTEDTIYMAFVMESDISITSDGWYIDSVTVADLPLATATTNNPKGSTMETDGLPLDATISVPDTNRSTSTNLADGSYSLMHEAGSFNVVAEAYGFYPSEQEVTIVEDDAVQAHFTLDELPTYTASGSVTSAKTGEAIEGATLLLVEDANVEPVETDAEGNFELSGFEGDYTLRVIAEGFHPAEMEIELTDNMTVDFALDPFYTVPGGEIGYDDGTVENARAFYDAGNGWAVRMSLPDGAESAIVTDGVFQFYDERFPDPGGTAFEVEVWSANANGMPGEKLAGPVEADAVRDLEEWTVVDLREHNIQVEGDFFMVYIQSQVNTEAPALGTDEDGELAQRSFQYADGSWSQSPDEEGNYMIRARVDLAVEDPAITTPAEGTITNENEITVEGNASPNTDLTVTNNGEDVISTTADEEGNFAVTVELTEGQNDLQAVTYVDGEDAAYSEVTTVTLDTAAPELTIVSPTDGELINRETVEVQGTVTDDHFESVTVNGEQAEVAEDGTFSHRIMLDEGENVIEVAATDAAGNMTEQSLTVSVDSHGPVVENVNPESDQHLETGQTLTVSFDGEPGLNATFSILAPLTNVNATANATELPMHETSEGHYEGTYTVTNNVEISGGKVSITAVDSHGNETTVQAAGSIFLNEEVEEEPVEPLAERLYGDNRYGTAAELSKDGWDSSDVVVLASGTNFADALTGVPLAEKLDAPLLLTHPELTMDETKEELERLGAKTVYVLGGEVAIGNEVLETILPDGAETIRVAGDTRVETAVEIAKLVLDGEAAQEVVVVNGYEFADALSVASYAAKEGMPILLTEQDKLPAGTEAALSDFGVEETLVIGGEVAIAENVTDQLPKVTRVAGKDRWETSIEVAKHFNPDTQSFYVTTGYDFPDALASGARAAKDNTGVILTAHAIPEYLSDYILEKEVNNLRIVGGEKVVSPEMFDALEELIK